MKWTLFKEPKPKPSIETLDVSANIRFYLCRNWPRLYGVFLFFKNPLVTLIICMLTSNRNSCMVTDTKEIIRTEFDFLMSFTWFFPYLFGIVLKRIIWRLFFLCNLLLLSIALCFLLFTYIWYFSTLHNGFCGINVVLWSQGLII